MGKDWTMSKNVTLAEFRKARGLSQNKLARMIGCTQSSVGRWELGQKPPSSDNQSKLAAIGYEGNNYAGGRDE